MHKSLVVPTHHTRDSSGRFSAHYEPADDPNYCNSTSTPHNPATSSAEFVTPDGKYLRCRDRTIQDIITQSKYYFTEIISRKNISEIVLKKVFP